MSHPASWDYVPHCGISAGYPLKFLKISATIRDMGNRDEYVKQRARGLSAERSAVMSGYSQQNAQKLDRRATVVGQLAKLRAETARNMSLTKEDVAAGLLEAAQQAQIMSDVAGMVAAWRELGRLLGFYAPEVKKVERSFSKSDLKHAVEALSDEELRRLAGGRVIEGEVTGKDERRNEADVPALPQG